MVGIIERRLRTLRIGVEVETMLSPSHYDPCYECDCECSAGCPYYNMDFEERVCDNVFGSSKIASCFYKIYHDGSCGIEFCTKPFNNPLNLFKFLKWFVGYIGDENLDEYYECGGHLNLSFCGWTNNLWKSWRNVTYVSDILIYAFNYLYTYRRDSWRIMAKDINESWEEKYSHIHLHDNRFEIRILDTPKSPDNYALAVLFIIPLFVSNKAVEKRVWTEDKDATYWTYTKISEHGQNSVTESDIKFMEKKLNYVFERFKDEFSFCERYYNVRIRKAVMDRFYAPAFETPRFNLERYRVNRKLTVFCKI